MLHVVILAGGSGTRFWPASRHAYPKQFLPLLTDQTLLQTTFDRACRLVPVERIHVATRTDFADEVLTQIPSLPREQLLLEPLPRNTAPCLAVAARRLHGIDPDAVMLVLPSDHHVDPVSEFERCVRTGLAVVDACSLQFILFGIRPTSPHTGYGYLEAGAALPLLADADDLLPVHGVCSFREKPDWATAQEYLAAGTFFWNSGMFLWRADTFLRELTAHADGVAAVLSALPADPADSRWVTTFADFPSISVDYAILERTAHIAMIEATFAWDDLGSWEALARHRPSDSHGNTTLGTVVLNDTSQCIVQGAENHLIAVSNVSDLVIVHTPEATLIARRGDEAGLRTLIDQIKQKKLTHHL